VAGLTSDPTNVPALPSRLQLNDSIEEERSDGEQVATCGESQ